MSSSSYFELFWSFAKVGLFTFGGGYAMIPIIENLCVEKKRWLTAEEMAQTIVISQSTPGPIAINCATFVGFKQHRWLGAICTTIGICLPSFAIIYLISLFFQNFLQYSIVVRAFEGIQIAVGLLVLQAGIKMIRQEPASVIGYSILALSAAMVALDEFHLLPLSSNWAMLGAVMLSLLYYVASGASRAEAQTLAEGDGGQQP